MRLHWCWSISSSRFAFLCSLDRYGLGGLRLFLATIRREGGDGAGKFDSWLQSEVDDSIDGREDNGEMVEAVDGIGGSLESDCASVSLGTFTVSALDSAGKVSESRCWQVSITVKSSLLDVFWATEELLMLKSVEEISQFSKIVRWISLYEEGPKSSWLNKSINSASISRKSRVHTQKELTLGFCPCSLADQVQVSTQYVVYASGRLRMPFRYVLWDKNDGLSLRHEAESMTLSVSCLSERSSRTESLVTSTSE